MTGVQTCALPILGDTFKEGEGMGWTIIRSMVKEKLGGHIMVKSDSRGTKVKIVF